MKETAATPPRPILETSPDDGSDPVFEEPWQARIFALVCRMHMDGHCSWDDFKALLIDEIEANGSEDGGDYYERWLSAAERLTTAKGLTDRAALSSRKEHLARHPPHPTAAAPGPIAVDPAARRE